MTTPGRFTPGRAPSCSAVIAGWKTFDMVREYTEERGRARARQAHARLSPGDRI